MYRHSPRIPGQGTHLTRDELQRSFRKRAVQFRMERDRYALHFQAGLAFAVLFVIGAFSLDFGPRETADLTFQSQEVVTMQDIIQTRQDLKPPPPPRPQIPVEVPDDVILEDEDLLLGELFELTELTPPPPPAPVVEEEEEETIFVVVEEMPEMVGGHGALYKTIQYPRLAQRAGIEGDVIVQVVIGPDGLPAMPEVVRSAHEVLDKEAVRAIMAQEFTPGKQRGKPVPVRMSIPVRFKLLNG